ncbi:hypothetical protein A3B58_04450 [Candidatus Amesbacteria bacterium RIFCSPLOWO2_01_FULL_48_50]|nr:MAG: hypothetical protein A2V48_03350 [Candidatus Amesbacteria bacterium RBG_19FT_COMBO_48_16]OGD04987.1 MAG: hypothetical protein A3B58_04450 [Candidatus Amesbacteria bacterium RIFCSPLOWO2_01_FULL_48_50]
MSGLVFGNARVSHHCKREAETGFDAVVTEVAATMDNQLAARLIVQSCIGARKSIFPGGCEMRNLAGLTDEQMQVMLRLSEI